MTARIVMDLGGGNYVLPDDDLFEPQRGGRNVRTRMEGEEPMRDEPMSDEIPVDLYHVMAR